MDVLDQDLGIELLTYTPTHSLTLLCKGRIVKVELAAIMYIHKQGIYSMVYTQEDRYQTMRSLAELMNELPVRLFARINRSCIISLHQVEKFKGSQVILMGETFLLTRYYKKQLLQLLQLRLEQSYKAISYETRIPTPL